MENVIVETKQGLLKGFKDHEGKIWRGIPYAEPPIGNLRLKPPQPPLNWQGIRDALEFSPICPQINEESVLSISQPEKQSEDCLSLNIWAPETTEKPLPVMVWIHGGAFRSGSGSLPFYNGAKLSGEGQVIVVTINYRLGAFGFLQLKGLDDNYTANLGLLDQLAALKWVQENIKAFGGDANQVTIFGESAGSMSVAALLAMPQSKGLFQRAIMESGASSVIPPDMATNVASEFVAELGGNVSDLSVLMSASTDEYLQASRRVEEKYGQNAGMLYQPTIDHETLPMVPEMAIAQGAAEGIALLIGTNHDEGHYFFRPEGMSMSKEHMLRALAGFVGIEVAQKLIELYPPTIDGQAQMMTDFVFWKPAITFAENQSQHAPVWMYRFDWSLPGHPVLGKTIHAIEIPFVFNNLDVFQGLNVSVNESMKKLANRMQKAWVTFARHGKPELSEDTWEPYEPIHRTTLIFNETITVESNPYGQKRVALFKGSSR